MPQDPHFNNAMTILMQTMNFASAVVSSMAQVFTAIAEHDSVKDPASFKLSKALKSGDELYHSECESMEECKSLFNTLSRNGIPCKMKVFQEKGKDAPAFHVIFLKSDTIKVQQLIDEKAAHSREGIQMSQERLAAGGKVINVQNLNAAEVDLYKTLARKYHVNFAVQNPEKGKFNFLCLESDSKPLAMMQTEASILMTGKVGEFLQEMSTYKEKEFQLFNDAIRSKAKDKCYVVDRKENGTITLDKYRAVINMPGTDSQTISAKDRNLLRNETIYSYMQMSAPVLLTKAQYEQLERMKGKTKKETAQMKETFLESIACEHGMPVPDSDVKQEFANKKEMESELSQTISDVTQNYDTPDIELSVPENLFGNKESIPKSILTPETADNILDEASDSAFERSSNTSSYDQVALDSIFNSIISQHGQDRDLGQTLERLKEVRDAMPDQAIDQASSTEFAAAVAAFNSIKADYEPEEEHIGQE